MSSFALTPSQLAFRQPISETGRKSFPIEVSSFGAQVSHTTSALMGVREAFSMKDQSAERQLKGKEAISRTF